MKHAIVGLALSLGAIGCSAPGGLQDARHLTGSSTLVGSSDYQALYAVNTDAGSVARYAPGSTAVDQVAVGAEPTRIARAGNRVFVTLRADRAVAVLEETPAGLQLVDTVPVGAEPYGVVANEAGTRVWVAVSQADRVVEIDASSREILRSWNVPGEPRYVALHPSERSLFVATGNGSGKVVRIDLRAEPTTASGESDGEAIPLPGIIRFDDEGRPLQLTVRITGDPAVSPDGAQVVVPVVYVDNITPVGTPDEEAPGEMPVEGGYGSATEGIGRFNPAVVVIPVDVVGEPDGDVESVFISATRFEERSGEVTRVRSYPSSVVVAPDNNTYVVTVQGSESVVVVGALAFDSQNLGFTDGPIMVDAMPEPGFPGQGFFTSPTEAGFAMRPKALVQTRGLFAPSGAAFLDDMRAYVHSPFDRVVADLDYGQAFDTVRRHGINGFDDISSLATLSRSPELGEVGVPSEVDRGRRLFFASTNPSMVAAGAGVSCASCHFEGRNDGLTWSFTSGDRQTPSLAGEVALTEPVTWTSAVSTVAEEARLTTELRMGGHNPNFNDGVARPDYDAIAAFVNWTRQVDVPDRGLETPAVLRGKAIFERADVGCASCHNGPVYTDNGHHRMFGLDAVNTPTLVGIAASAPYLHDGRASDLRELLEWSRTGEMGDTSMLSEAEMTDLEAYLRSL